MSDDLKRGDDGTAADAELAVNDLDPAAVDKTTAATVRGGLGGTATPGGPVPIPYPTTSPPSSGTTAP